MKKLNVILLILFGIFAFSGNFLVFDNTIIINHSPIFLVLGDGFGVGYSYATNTTYYTEQKLGFLKIKKPAKVENMNFSLFAGTSFGIYLSIGYENLNFPTSSQGLEFFVSDQYSFFTSNSNSFVAVGPISLSTEKLFLRKGKDFGYSLDRYFIKYKDFSGYILLLNGKNFLGYLYSLDNSLQQGILAGLGTDFGGFYLNIGARKYFSAGEFRGFGYGYIYSSTNDIFNINYLFGVKFIVPLKGEFLVWDGKIAFRFNW